MQPDEGWSQARLANRWPWNQSQGMHQWQIAQPYGGQPEEQPKGGGQASRAPGSLPENPVPNPSWPQGRPRDGQRQTDRDGVLCASAKRPRAEPNDRHPSEGCGEEEEEASGPEQGSQSDDCWGSWSRPGPWEPGQSGGAPSWQGDSVPPRVSPEDSSQDWRRGPGSVPRDRQGGSAPSPTPAPDQHHRAPDQHRLGPHGGQSQGHRRPQDQGRPGRHPGKRG